MEFIPSIKLDHRTVDAGDADRAFAINHERLISLSSWMMILGTIRAVCGFADLAGAFLNASRAEPISWHMLGSFIEENQPLLALGVAWPLALGILVCRTRWPELLLASGVTFLFLSIGGLLETMAEWNHPNDQGITLGSFHLTRLALVKPAASDVILGVLGACQLMVECATGVRSLVLYRQMRGANFQPDESGKQEGARRARLGRLAVYGSIGFLVLMIRLPVWSTYLEIINESKIVRDFVLRTDDNQASRPRRPMRLSKSQERTRDLQQQFAAAFVSTSSGNFLAAREAYKGLISRAESIDDGSRMAGDNAIIAEAENNLAWLLATCPQIEIRDSREAVKHARVAVDLEPNTGNYWNTLGVAFYRNGEWNLAYDALNRSMRLRGNGGDSFDWFFLAMIDHRQGRKDGATEWYDKAVTWYHTHQTLNDNELYRFQIEAARELGLPEPAAAPRASTRTGTNRTLQQPIRVLSPKARLRPLPAEPDPSAPNSDR